MNNLTHIQLFVMVVEKGSFSEAARFLGLTPSSVSRQISLLEQDLGARLFHRTTRRQSLTEAGEIYFQHTRRIALDMEDALLAVRRLIDKPSGNLHVTAEADFASAFIAPILPRFLNQYPAVEVRLSMNAGKLDLVENGLDIAIRIGHLDDSSLIARKIATSHSLVCASPKYLARHGLPKHPDELQGHNCLSFRTNLGKNYWNFRQDQENIDVLVSGNVSASSLVFLRQVAIDGLGLIMVPSWVVSEALEQGQLVPVLEDFSLMPKSTPVHAFFAHNRQLAPKVRAFVDFLAEQMKPL